MEWLSKQWDRLHGEIIGGLIVSALLAIGAGIWALIQTWAAPLVIPLVIGVFAITLLAVNQLHLLLARRGIKNLEDFVVKVLYKRGVSIRKDQNPDAIFQFTLTYADEQIVVAQTTKRSEFLTVGIKLNVADDDQALLDKVTSKPKSTVIEELKIEMARFGVMYQGLSHPLRSITIMTVIPCLNLKEIDFLAGLEFVRRARILLEALIRKEIRTLGMLGKIQPKQSIPDKEGSQT